jgi:hypothetical protein
MEWEWALIGLLAAVTLVLATWADSLSKQRSDLLSAGFILFLSWPLASVINLLFSPPESMLIAPVTDALFASALLYSLRRQYQAWKLVLLGLVATQAFFHIAYQIRPYQPHMLYLYTVELNVTYSLQLLCVAITGGRNVFSYYRRPWLRRIHSVHFLGRTK